MVIHCQDQLNRLQNAVSFNYYANTEMYDVRSDSVVDGKYPVEGLKLSQIKTTTNWTSEL